MFPILIFGQSDDDTTWVKEFLRLNNRPPTPSEAQAYLVQRDSIWVLNFQKEVAGKMEESLLMRDTIVHWLDNWVESKRNFPHVLLEAYLDAYFSFNREETLEYLMTHWNVVRYNTSIHQDRDLPYAIYNSPFVIYLFNNYSLNDILSYLSENKNIFYEQKIERVSYLLNAMIRISDYKCPEIILSKSSLFDKVKKLSLKNWLVSAFALTSTESTDVNSYRESILNLLSN